jgi:Domain of unknown function (DUF4386)
VLALLGGGPYASALPARQLQALAYLPGELSHLDHAIHTVFFGFDILCMAYLVLRSKFLPSAIGALLAVDGAAYVPFGTAGVASSSSEGG